MEHKRENIYNCPICSSQKQMDHIRTKDYFLSQELFEIRKCGDCGFKFTNPRPTKNHIESYYQSEDYISHSNKSRGLFAIFYQLARKINLVSKYSILSKHSHIGKALDIGSGTGHFLNYLRKKNWEVQGIEPDEKAANFARDNFNLQIDKEGKLAELANGSFDLITLWHVLEHVYDLNSRFAELKRLVDPKGLIILALPNPDSFDAKYYKKFWAAYDVPRHLYHFTKDDIKRLAIKYNLRIENIYPMRLDAFYVSLLSEKYINRKLSFFRAFYIALISNLKSSAKNPNTSSLIYILRSNTA